MVSATHHAYGRDVRFAAVALLLTTACAGVAQKPGGAGGAAPIDARPDMGPSMDASVTEPIARDAELPRCGNGKIDTALGEACDDGNTRSGRRLQRRLPRREGLRLSRTRASPASTRSSAATACSVASSSAIRPPSAPAARRLASSSRGTCATRRRRSPIPPKPASCHRTVCGDGSKEGTEACDDGNAVDGDGCAGRLHASSRTAAPAPARRSAATRVKLAPGSVRRRQRQGRRRLLARLHAGDGFHLHRSARQPARPAQSARHLPRLRQLPAGRTRPAIPTSRSSRAMGDHAIAGEADAGREWQAGHGRTVRAARASRPSARTTSS